MGKVILPLIFACIILFGCTEKNTNIDNNIPMGQNYDSIKDISQNPEKYLGKTVLVKGTFSIGALNEDIEYKYLTDQFAKYHISDDKNYYINVNPIVEKNRVFPGIQLDAIVKGTVSRGELCQCKGIRENKLASDDSMNKYEPYTRKDLASNCINQSDYFHIWIEECEESSFYYYINATEPI